jgi:hypothetical protein
MKILVCLLLLASLGMLIVAGIDCWRPFCCSTCAVASIPAADIAPCRDMGADTVATEGAPGNLTVERATANEGHQQHKRQLEHQGIPT